VLAAAFPDAAAQLSARAQEAGLSTFYAGIHYENDVDQGLALGAAVAKKVLDHARLPLIVSTASARNATRASARQNFWKRQGRKIRDEEQFAQK